MGRSPIAVSGRRRTFGCSDGQRRPCRALGEGEAGDGRGQGGHGGHGGCRVPCSHACECWGLSLCPASVSAAHVAVSVTSWR